MFKCKGCKKTFVSEKNLNRHIETIHEGGNLFDCSICDESFAREDTLKRHISKVHEGSEALKYPKCDETFNRKDNFQRHISSAHEGKKKFQCSQCDKSYARKDLLKNHITSFHEGKKPWKCNLCEAAFPRKDTLVKHKSQVHGDKKWFPGPFDKSSVQQNFNSEKNNLYSFIHFKKDSYVIKITLLISELSPENSKIGQISDLSSQNKEEEKNRQIKIIQPFKFVNIKLGRDQI